MSHSCQSRATCWPTHPQDSLPQRCIYHNPCISTPKILILSTKVCCRRNTLNKVSTSIDQVYCCCSTCVILSISYESSNTHTHPWAKCPHHSPPLRIRVRKKLRFLSNRPVSCNPPCLLSLEGVKSLRDHAEIELLQQLKSAPHPVQTTVYFQLLLCSSF